MFSTLCLPTSAFSNRPRCCGKRTATCGVGKGVSPTTVAAMDRVRTCGTMRKPSRTWDPDQKGALFEPHHNTYDIEFWGAEPMCTGIYLGALSAMAQMATAVRETGDAELYGGLAHKSAAYMDQHLFNGEYYEQKVQ